MSVGDGTSMKACDRYFWRSFWITVLIWPLMTASLIVIVSELTASNDWPQMGPLTSMIVFIAYGNVWAMILVFLFGAYAGCATSAVLIGIGIGWARAKRMPWLPACLVIAIGVAAIVSAVVAIAFDLGGIARFLLGYGLVSGLLFPDFLILMRPIWSWSWFLNKSVDAAAVFIPTTMVCWWASSVMSRGK
jgi:hypothetical protein